MRKIYVTIASTATFFTTIAQQGTLDSAFNPGTGADSAVFTTNLQPDGKNFIAGDFFTYNGTSALSVARINADGTIDNTFNSGGGANDLVSTSVLQPDGKILIGGLFSSYNGTARGRVARLNANGSVDTSFNPGTGANNSGVSTIVLQPDGKILIGGDFTSYNGTTINRIVRLNADGSRDTSFDPGTGANFSITSATLQSDGKVLIGGNFTSYNGISRNRIARLNANGSLDTSFDPGTGANNFVWSNIIQVDGKILIGGDFTSYNGTATNRIARLNTDGSLDTSFHSGGTGANNTIQVITRQPDSKILIGGNFTSYNGTTTNRIARLNTDGSLDNAVFNPGTGADGMIYTVALQPNGKILIGGNFTSYNGTGRVRIARINGDPTLSIDDTELIALSLYPNPTNSQLNISNPQQLDIQKVTIYDLLGKLVMDVVIKNQANGTFNLDVSKLPNAVYLLTLTTDQGTLTKKLVKN